MDEARVGDLVRRTYEGEVLGAALFARLVSLEAEPSRRAMLLAAQLLEEQTKACVEGLAAELGVVVGDAEEQRRAGEQAGDVVAAMAWPDQMAAVAGATGDYRALYQELGSLLPHPEHAAMVELLAHERALNAFAAAESSGSEGSLGHLLGALDAERRSRVEAAAG